VVLTARSPAIDRSGACYVQKRVSGNGENNNACSNRDEAHDNLHGHLVIVQLPRGACFVRVTWLPARTSENAHDGRTSVDSYNAWRGTRRVVWPQQSRRQSPC
jgi:hypothetical protein